ncbi:amidohydrolase family protein [Spongiivirga citrea]|uniref:Amidohydrolase family protein n=1 Tax=Spongiivirga citrea TaxID=1481457 RepID=A0A6M0CFB3_9FLAO|nr:amidohydrolase family protein [Spongiivirga citrea]NER16548.1 amidohydrolase family protein [Spongiivirga citrea]
MKNCILLLCLAYCTLNCSQSTEYDLAITDVNVFNSKTLEVKEHQTVLINADTIAAIVNSDKKVKATKTINGDGRLLTPGFIDTHVHLIGNYGVDSALPEEYEADGGLEMLRELTTHHYLNHGVTTIIDMAQPEEWIDITLDWQNNPTSEYPDLYITGGSIVSDEDRRQPAHHIEVMNPEDGRKKVRDYAAKGLKYMKFYRKLRKPDYEAMADEARKQGIIVNTHVDNNVVTIGEAMDYGISNFEHFFTLTPSILDYDTHWPAMNEQYGIRMTSSIDEFAAQMVFFFGYIKEHPEMEEELMALFDTMATKGASISTALNVVASSAGQSDFFTSFEYYPIRKIPMVNYTEEQQKALDDAYNAMMGYYRKAHDKGVKIRIGTDCRFGGRALLSELILLSKAGFSIGEVLQIATLNGYESMQLDQTHGNIAVGKAADLILFDKNPFENTVNFLEKKTIIKDGKVLTAKRSVAYDYMQDLLNKGANTAQNSFKVNIDNEDYKKLQNSELKQVVKELFSGNKIKEAIASYSLYKSHFPEGNFQLDAVSITNTAYGLIRDNKLDVLKEYYAFCATNFPETKRYLGLSVYHEILNNGIEAGKTHFTANKDSADYILDENEINGLGYLYLQSGKTDEAIAVFKLNVEAFPESWNVYDSLGESLTTIGKKKEARQNYLKSLELNPESASGKAALKKLAP